MHSERPLTFLAVDDESHLRLIVQHVLKSQGHQVLLAKDAQEARAVWENHQPIDVVLTDVKLPDAISGFDLAREFTAKRPDVIVGFTSGFVGGNAAAEAGIHLKEGVNYLPKPFNIARLVGFVQNLLSGSDATRRAVNQ